MPGSRNFLALSLELAASAFPSYQLHRPWRGDKPHDFALSRQAIDTDPCAPPSTTIPAIDALGGGLKSAAGPVALISLSSIRELCATALASHLLTLPQPLLPQMPTVKEGALLDPPTTTTTLLYSSWDDETGNGVQQVHPALIKWLKELAGWNLKGCQWWLR